MSGRDQLIRFRKAAPAVLPSLLLCDFGNLERELGRLEDAGVAGLHLDVMDGVFVPNFTYGMTIVEAVRRRTKLPLDVHLMIVEPMRHVRAMVDAGADLITVHVEAVERPRAALEGIAALGVGAGIALNPATPLDTLDACRDLCDLVLIMGVQAGFGGQSFQPVALEKLRAARNRVGDRVLLEVDGGVNTETIGDCALAGADLLVAGSAIFRTDDYTAAVSGLRALAAAASPGSGPERNRSKAADRPGACRPDDRVLGEHETIC
ncbi:MAG: ribulose-phosphate 3-epimerase [Planctomycetes bacterium]|nr:ribulose-phosphate 3-epimerase [Planctomycetota bacterium]